MNRTAIFLGLCSLGVAVNAYAQRLQQQQPHPLGNDIVVEGKRAVLKGGDWTLTLSRSYTYGTAFNPEDLRPTGSDKTWHMCLAATDVEPLMRILVGEGQTPSATAHCSRLQVRLGSGKLSATQSCFGTTMMAPSTDTGRIAVEQDANDHGLGPPRSSDRNASQIPPEAPTRAQNRLTVTGNYSNTRLRLDFVDVQEPEGPRPGGPPVRNERHWSIKGQRQGDCAKPVPK